MEMECEDKMEKEIDRMRITIRKKDEMEMGSMIIRIKAMTRKK